ncbi:hypothetical protein M8818_002767 [Zalaria obscura]|uniref:Uncharacterized protein n=1 Tax=Zalaria obscura TaxID=2024903 RepID=A0ACC3SGU0_9PEZI
MPRRREPTSADRQKPARTRTRTGCTRCRARKIKCDEAKPTCSQCRAKGFQCESGATLKWEVDYLARGLAFGRSGVWTKDPTRQHTSPYHDLGDEDVPWRLIPTIHPYSFVNATVGEVDELTTLDNGREQHVSALTVPSNRAQRRPSDASSTASLSPWLSKRQPVWSTFEPLTLPLNPVPWLNDPAQSMLMSYYLEQVCPLTVPSILATSPFKSLILPFSISSSPTVLDSLLALAACHRSKSDPSYRSTALSLSDKVLRTLRTRLKVEDSHKVAMDPETLVIMMILCLFEIVNNCDKRWVVHLKGARDLIRVRRQALLSSASTPSSNELVAFSEKFFAYQDVIGRTACGEEPMFGSEFWDAQGSETDPWLGCSPELASILCAITELSRQHNANPALASLSSFQMQAASLEERIDNLQQKVYDVEDDLLQTTAELKRIAAALYLHCALYDASPSTPVVSRYVQQVLQLVSALLEQNIMAGLAWPLFVAAVELEPVEDLKWCEDSSGAPTHARPFVLYALSRMEGSVANVSRARSVIQKVWQSREMDAVSETTHAKADGGQNDWEKHVAPLSNGLSLA